MNGIIIYQGKYGATEQYARWLADSLNISYINANDVTPAILANYDTIILGSSVYIGKLLIAKWIKSNRDALIAKKLLVFIVCSTSDEDAEEQHKIIDNNLDPAIRRAASVFFLPGRCIVSKLGWMDRFMLKMGARLQKDPVKKAKMSQDFDRMDRNRLNSLIAATGGALKPEQMVHIQ